MPIEPRAVTRMGHCTRSDDAEERGDGRTRTDRAGHPEHFVVTRMGHNEMLAEDEQSGCQHLTSLLIAKGPTCVAKRRNGKSPTGQQGIGVRFRAGRLRRPPETAQSLVGHLGELPGSGHCSYAQRSALSTLGGTPMVAPCSPCILWAPMTPTVRRRRDFRVPLEGHAKASGFCQPIVG